MAAPTNTVAAMAGAAAVLAYSLDDSSFTTLSNLKEINPGSQKKGAPKLSCLASPLAGNTPAHEFGPLSWIDPGEMSADAYFTKAGYAAALTILQNNVLYMWRLTFNKLSSESVSGSIVKCAGILTELGLSPLTTDDDNIVMVPIKIKFTGVLAFTQGS